MSEKLFLKQADSYIKARPTYPASLFKRLASLTQQHDRAWDVGTANGQAAVTIAEHYKSVVATDICELERVAGAEGSVDLVTGHVKIREVPSKLKDQLIWQHAHLSNRGPT